CDQREQNQRLKAVADYRGHQPPCLIRREERRLVALLLGWVYQRHGVTREHVPPYGLAEGTPQDRARVRHSSRREPAGHQLVLQALYPLRRHLVELQWSKRRCQVSRNHSPVGVEGRWRYRGLGRVLKPVLHELAE